MLRAGQLEKADAQRALAAIERNSLLQTQLISDLLDVSRIIAGRLDIVPRPASLVSNVTGAVESLRQEAERKGVGLLVEGAGHDCVIAGDPLRLQQIFTNLVGNAIEFTPRHGTVEVVIGRDGGLARVTVRDTGRGIPAGDLPHVFERFRKGDRTAARGEGGLGLGLSIVRHLVALHGGSVTADSAGAGRGAPFSVLLPIAESSIERPVEPLARAGPGDDTGAGSRALRGVTVLVVQDDHDTRELNALVLREHGAVVTVAASVAEAADALARSTPDVIVSDLRLSDGDGCDLGAHAQRLQRERGREMIPAVAPTGLGSEGERRRASSAGYRIHLLKPVDPFELVEVVSSLLCRSTS